MTRARIDLAAKGVIVLFGLYAIWLTVTMP